MGKPYQDELAVFPNTYAWAYAQPAARLSGVLAGLAHTPLLCVGSGGSLTTAHFAAQLHTERTGQLAQPMTPLAAAATAAHLPELSVLFVSAGGSNPDVLGAFRRVAASEPKHLLVMCARADSPLARLASEHQFAQVFEFGTPSGKDGFLATNSLLASAVLLKRAYDALRPVSDPLPPTLDDLLVRDFDRSLEEECHQLWERTTLSVLYGAVLQPAAIDLESRFTEAAVGHAQIADYRNFAHGRHHWVARHEREVAILSLESEDDQTIAARTLALLPDVVTRVRLRVSGSGTRASLAGIIFGMHLAGLAGRARKIDPGSPRVSAYGRELYHLQTFGSPSRKRGSAAMEELAIQRKTGAQFRQLAAGSEPNFWREAYRRFTDALRGASFDSLVLDYDGTLCDASEKATGLRPEVSEHLLRILAGGVRLGIATGRGESVRDDLRKAIPRSLWDRVTVGYHNGAEIAELADDARPAASREVGEELRQAERRIAQDPLLSRWVKRSSPRPRHIAIYPHPGADVRVVWRRLCELSCDFGPPGVTVLMSSHSLDVLAPGVSKRAVVDRVRASVSASPGALRTLCVGDRGLWPGNDYELLQTPHSLSVDEVSAAPDTCWRLSSAGVRGVQALIEYLAAFRVEKEIARVHL